MASSRHTHDAVVVGAGPNGLAAALTIAQAGRSVAVFEANDSIGGGARSAELTLPGYVHDLCSAVFPLGVASPFFRNAGLEAHRLEWIHPEIPLAHPLDDGRAVVLRRSLEDTAQGMQEDAAAYLRFMEPYVRQWKILVDEILQPLSRFPRHPLLMARFGLQALRPATSLGTRLFRSEPARALWAGLAAHSFLRLDQPASAAIGIVLALLGHAVGWPIARGGTQSIADALGRRILELGGEIHTGRRVQRLDELPPSRVVLLDVSPRQFLNMAPNLPPGYARALRAYRYGPAAFKIDYALREPIPWKAPECRAAGTIHLGGTLQEIATAEREATEGRDPPRPFVLVAQPSLIDGTRAPMGGHVAWAYCHVPHGSEFDMTSRLEAQIERFAPGFRDCVLARHVTTPRQFEERNSNMIGGDINGGLANLRQVIARPVAQWVPYRTPLTGVYLCSASTPPGGGVHGMAGFNAARAALQRELA